MVWVFVSTSEQKKKWGIPSSWEWVVFCFFFASAFWEWVTHTLIKVWIRGKNKIVKPLVVGVLDSAS
jgi:hypothetical protein